jgi:magnesium transporter
MDNNNFERNYVEEIVNLIRSDESNESIAEALEEYHDNDIAEAFEELESDERKKLCRILGAERASDMFSYIEDAGQYIEELELESAAQIIENMDADDAVDLLEDIDEDMQEKIVSMIDDESSRDIELILSYDEDEIGSLMTTNFIEIPNNVTVKQAMKSLIKQAEENDNISTIYTYDENGKFYGALDLKELILARVNDDLKELITTSYPFVRDHDLISDCLERIKDYAEDSIPVLNDENKIIGVITSQDIVEVVDDEMSEDYAKLAGLTAEEDLNEPLLDSLKKRMPWLFVLLLLGMCVSSVVGLFENVVSQLAIVVSFQSLILDMAGNVGTQSLAVTIRVLMDEEVSPRQKLQLVFKEMRIGLANGFVLGILSFVFIGLYVMIIKGKPPVYAFSVSGCVGVALMLAMLISSMVGTAIPIFFHKMKIDPAVASGPLITTINDLVAVVSYYGLVWLLLINVLNLS